MGIRFKSGGIDVFGGTATVAPPEERCELEPVSELGGPSDLERVVAHLQDLEGRRRLNEFTFSLLTQYEAKGTLSDRQIAAVLRNLDAPPLPGPDVVPAGRYALTADDGETYFVRVWRGDRNPNYVRCYLLHGGSDSPVQNATTLQSIIDAGPREAAIRYGLEIRHCCICNIRLTKRLSRELGIGPVCGGRFYAEAEWAAIQRDKRDELEALGLDPDENVDDAALAVS